MGIIRDLALEHMAETARSMGKSEAEIKAARDECIRTNSDKPFQDLIMPDVMKMFGLNRV